MRALLAMLLAAACAPVTPAPPAGTAPELPLRLIGTEPFWGARISSEEISLSGVDRPERRLPTPAVQTEAGATVYAVAGARIVLQTGPCSDGMSDRVYPFSAELAVGDERLLGCAIPERLLEAQRP